MQVIIGLGSNLGNRKAKLDQAIDLLSKSFLSDIRVSPIYETQALLRADAPKSWNKPFLNMAIGGRTFCSPSELLHGLKVLERQLGRREAERWCPRVIDMDILAWGGRVVDTFDLVIPHAELLQRSFALVPLAHVAPYWRYPVEGAYKGREAADLCKSFGYFEDIKIIGLSKPSIIGILNVTPDSFSDGDRYMDPNMALAQYRLLVKGGASVVDIGAESTRPGAVLLTHEEEWVRLVPVLEKIANYRKLHSDTTLLSLDSRHVSTLVKSLAFGVSWANYVGGGYDEVMCELIMEHDLKLTLMHATTVPADPKVTLAKDKCVLDQVLRWGEKRLGYLIEQGIQIEQIVFDPGIGFGKTCYQSIKLINNIDKLSKLGVSLMLGHSRKSFMNVFTQLRPHERDLETAFIAASVGRYVDYLRVHDVEATRRALVTSYFIGQDF